jgi:hypothetical protein
MTTYMYIISKILNLINTSKLSNTFSINTVFQYSNKHMSSLSSDARHVIPDKSCAVLIILK